MRPYLSVFAAIATCIAPLGASAGEILNIGDPAPPLAVSGWVKGEKIDRFESGKTYVVEFWATWCGPCVASMPHLTELAHKFKDKGVRFIGVDVFERDTKLVKPFVDEMGDKMDYDVALDIVPEGGDPGDGAMAKTWLKAAEEFGIPATFVVHDGMIAWIGHPMSLDEPLAKITAGDWDPSPLAKKRLADKARERKFALVRAKVFTPYDAGDFKAALAAIEEATSGDSGLARMFAGTKFAALCNGGDIESGLVLGAELLETHKDNPVALNTFFRNVIDPKLKNEVDPRVARIALQAARRAVELTKSENMLCLDTLAACQFRTGDFAGAVATEEKALKCLEAVENYRAHPNFKQFNENLERYRKAAGEKADR